MARWIGLAVAVASNVVLANRSPAQIVGSPVALLPDPGPTVWMAETAIGVSPLNPAEFLVGARRVYPMDPSTNPDKNRVYYGISTKPSGPDFSAAGNGSRGVLELPTFIDCPISPTGVDPMVAWSAATGDLWIGAQLSGAFQVYGSGFYVARRPLGTSTLMPTVGVLCDLDLAWDKPFMAVGPRPQSGPETMYLASRISLCLSPSEPIIAMTESTWTNSPVSVPGAAWDTRGFYTNSRIIRIRDVADDCQREATGPAPLVLSSGRVVMAYRPWAPPPGPGDLPIRYPPEVMWLDPPTFPTPQTQLWSTRQVLDEAYFAPFPAPGETILPVDEALVGTKPVPNFPGICGDPRAGREGDVYVCFAGITPSTGLENIDLFIARGIPNAQGQLVFDFTRTLHIKDADLRDPAGTHQFMPWIAVDQQGGINLLYYTQTQSSPTLLKAHYARIREFQVPLATTDRPFVAALTAAFPPLVPPLTANAANIIGDYHQIATAGCYVYVAYMSTETGFYNVYVRRINICTGDVDDDSFVGAGDVPAFASAYLAQSPAADLTQDGNINAWDVATFTEALACQCNPQQP